ncbi:uncharacterized protein LOC107459028 [Arachis duranensis]|uniref:Uncharacterized protein LOC107459028 n=1 Tax=Arachis duranensis TaxID=130453 RepID=A0A6P4B274_ARADU|nr:uncharacterized protein LOC107459028 [Arachis duranensis]XP_025608012.1 uncharacterized protein LOC112701478 [Arachis hypogaea]
MVADTLNIKSLSISWMMIKEEKLLREFKDLNLGIREVTGNVCLNQLHISSDFKAETQKAQQDDQELQTMLQEIEQRKRGEVTQDREGTWRYKGRSYVPNVGDLRREVLTETHRSGFSIHPGATKMYHDLKAMFWWLGMKNDVSMHVSKYLTCQKVKIEHQTPSGMSQPLEIS